MSPFLRSESVAAFARFQAIETGQLASKPNKNERSEPMSRIILTALAILLCVGSANYDGFSQKKTSNATATINVDRQATPRLTERQEIAIGELKTLIKENTVMLSDVAAERIYGATDLALQSTLILWKYEPEFADRSFKDVTGILMHLYEKGRREKHDRERINYTRRALSHAINLWLSKDIRNAVELLQRLHKFEEELRPGSGQRAGAERFELANELLDIDPKQSASLAERIVEVYLPEKLPEYLYKLKQIDPVLNSRVVNKSLGVLAAGQVYSFKDDLILQAYVLRESMIVFPEKGPVDFPGFESLAFPASGVRVIDYAINSAGGTDRNELAQYTRASISALQRKLTESNGIGGLDAATAYFLIQKLEAHFQLSHSRAPNSLIALQRVGATVATSNGLSGQNLTHLTTIAREVISNRFLNLLSSNVSSAAEKTNDPILRARARENEIIEDIHHGKFDAASEKIFKLDDPDTREALTDNLYVSMINDASKKRDWITVDECIEKIKNWNVRTYVMLESARTALKVDSARTSQYLNAARRIIEGKLGTKERAQMVVGLLALYSESDSNGLQEILATAARYINGPMTEDDSPQMRRGEKGMLIARYVGNDIWISGKGIVGDAIRYRLNGTSLETAFAGAGKRDWFAAYTAAREIQDRSLRTKAILGACRAIL